MARPLRIEYEGPVYHMAALLSDRRPRQRVDRIVAALAQQRADTR
jgi:hypothetical protein